MKEAINKIIADNELDTIIHDMYIENQNTTSTQRMRSAAHRLTLRTLNDLQAIIDKEKPNDT